MKIEWEWNAKGIIAAVVGGIAILGGLYTAIMVLINWIKG